MVRDSALTTALHASSREHLCAEAHGPRRHETCPGAQIAVDFGSSIWFFRPRDALRGDNGAFFLKPWFTPCCRPPEELLLA